MRTYSIVFAAFLTIFLMAASLQAQNCDCTEYIYLNEPSNGGKVHKYMVNADGSLFEILNSGNAWYPGPNASGLPNPHGLGSDLNGYLYVAETGGNGRIRRLNCEGTLFPDTDFLITNTGFTANITSVDNTLYTNQRNSFDICTETFEAEVILDNNASNENWGFFIDDNTGFYYSTNSEGGTGIGEVWRYTAADYGTGVPVAPFLTYNDFLAAIPSFGYNDLVRMAITDDQGNLYVTVWDYDATNQPVATHLVKFDSNGNYINHVTDTIEGDGGFFFGAGMVFSETSGYIYMPTQSLIEDCVAYFDTNLNYLGAAVSPTGGTGQGNPAFGWAKAISIIKECCPNPGSQTIDRVYCGQSVDEVIYLNEYFNCDGIVCEGTDWTPDNAASAAVFDDCMQNLQANLSPGCYSFSKTSDGTSTNAQCGAFTLNFNIEILDDPTVSVSADQSICENDPPSLLSLTTTNADSYQWQMNTTSCATSNTWSDIPGATSATYQPPAIGQTHYYRAIVSNDATCSSESCQVMSDCITVTTINCCPSDDCAGITVTGN